jgi:hypothetical protein
MLSELSVGNYLKLTKFTGYQMQLVNVQYAFGTGYLNWLINHSLLMEKFNWEATSVSYVSLES